MDIIIRPAETSDFDSVVHILNQVQALHVNWRPDIYKESKDFFSLDAFQDALDKEAFYVAESEHRIIGILELTYRHIEFPSMLTRDVIISIQWRLMKITEVWVSDIIFLKC